jgi:5'-deoxynucleotidase YfbR-like HD superfamily hydrolase
MKTLTNIEAEQIIKDLTALNNGSHKIKGTLRQKNAIIADKIQPFLKSYMDAWKEMELQHFGENLSNNVELAQQDKDKLDVYLNELNELRMASNNIEIEGYTKEEKDAILELETEYNFLFLVEKI